MLNPIRLIRKLRKRFAENRKVSKTTVLKLFTPLVVGIILFAAIDGGIISVNLNRNSPSIQKVGSTPKPAPSKNPTPSPASTIKPTSTPSLQPSIRPSYRSTSKPLASPSIIPNQVVTLNGNNILSLINAYRLQNDIPQLNQSEEICQLAQERADFLVKEDPQGQKSSSGRHYMFEEFIQSKNIKYALGENQYGTTHSGDIEVVEGWKKSPSHNSLMLAREYSGDTYTRGCVRATSNGQESVIIFLIGGN